MPANSAYALRQAYRRAGVRPPKPGLIRQPPPRVRLLEREYAVRLERVIRAWHDRIETIGRGLTRSDAARADAIDDELKAVFDVLVHASGLEEWLTRTARKISADQAAYTKRVLKIPPAGVSPQEAIEDFRRRNVRLITRMSEEQSAKIADILRPAQATGARWEDVAPEIEERIGVTESRARLIARDQTNKFNGAMQRAQQQGAGISEYVWSTSKDMAVRGRPGGIYEDSQENHWALEGKRFKWSEPPIIPGTSERAHPGERIQCRCVAIPVVPFFE